MKKLCLLLATAFACSSAHAGEVVGVPDGGYCAPGGDFILVLSKEESGDPASMIGIDGLDCHSPRVTRGRLIARSCYSNGGHAFAMNVDFRATEGKIFLAMSTNFGPVVLTDSGPSSAR